MIGASLLLAATLAVSAADRLAMADRLFNRGEFAAARAEYRALAGTKDVAAEELAYRLVASADALRDVAAVKTDAAAYLAAFPAGTQADAVRLMLARVGSPDESKLALKLLDRDGVKPAIRAEALYHLARLTNDAALYARVVQTDPKGRFAGHAHYAHATALLKSSVAKDRRKGVGELMDLACGKDVALAKAALSLAAVTSYREGRYGESRSLVKRYQKMYPQDAQAPEIRRLAALSEFADGQFAAAVTLCTDPKDETLAYVKAASTRALDPSAGRVLLEQYLVDFPQGANRAAVDLQLARLSFDAALKGAQAPVILAAARRTAALSKSASDRLRLGWALENAHEAAEAEAIYEAVARDFPKTAEAAEALYRRALSLLRREQWSAAELALTEAIASEKLAGERVAAANYWRGMAALRLNHAEEGARLLKAALEKGLGLDEAREARLAIADVDLAAGRREAAVAAYRTLVREGALARMSAAKTLAVGRLLADDEARACARALMANKEATWRQFGAALLGDVETQAKNYAAATEAYRKALAEPCTTEAAPAASLALGTYLVRAGEADEAEKVFTRAVELNKANAEARAAAYLGLARAALLKKDVEKARGYATVVVTLFEKSSAAAEAKEILK